IRVKEESAKFGLKLNVKKTKVMSTKELKDFIVDGERIEVVESYILLGSKIERNGSCEGEIRRRINLGRTAMANLTKIMKDKDISIHTKKIIVEAMVFPVTLYGCESWTLRKKERKMIDAFELWVWRRLLRVPWTEKKTNISILEKIKPSFSLQSRILKQKLTYFGHVMRKEVSLEKTIMLGKVEGRRKRGRQRIRWIEKIEKVTEMKLEELRETTRERSRWRRLHEVTRSRRRLDGT
ncbi:uncharacterized protein LOC111634534, partial [Centruroides sculpturatus]|uniref:uncharacterized protein LOC111634534 n=1 Tax=Centruroides sculpturatus TaxID=218467 RepID=UPI000C6DEE46